MHINRNLLYFCICVLGLAVDGYDTQIIGFSAAAIAKKLEIPASDFGQIFSVGLIGAAIGAVVFGSAADYISSKYALVVSILMFSIFTFVTPIVSEFQTLLGVRFFAGLGLGGAVPNILALATERVSRNHFGLMAGTLYAGFPLGGLAGAALSSTIFYDDRWTSLFVLGGALPLLICVALIALGPPQLSREVSQDTPTRNDASGKRFQLLAKRFHSCVFHIRSPGFINVYIGNFKAKFLNATSLLLALSFFGCFMILIVLVLWTPLLLRSEQVSSGQATWAAGMINLGSIVGTLVGGRMIDRFPAKVVLPILFVVGGTFAAPIGFLGSYPELLYVDTAVCGFLFGAGSSALLAVSILIYPPEMRSSGIGWSLSFGRLGQVIGPVAVGIVYGFGLSGNLIFMLVLIPASVAAISASSIHYRHGAAQ